MCSWPDVFIDTVPEIFHAYIYYVCIAFEVGVGGGEVDLAYAEGARG